MRRLLGILGILLLTVVAAAPVAANDDPFSGGALMARGKSPAGVPWRVRGKQVHRAITFNFSVKPPGYPDAGYFSTLPVPFPRRFVFTADSGSDLSPASEGDLSGLAAARVATIRVRMSDGSAFEIHPDRPAAKVRKRNPWARRINAFETFFGDSAHPVVARAFDRNGDLLERTRSHQGLFP